MDLSSKLCMAITKTVAKTLKDLSEEEIEKIYYGLMILVSNSLKLAVVLLIAYFLGVFRLVLITFFVFGLLRTFAGGVHAKTPFGCLVAITGVYLAVVYCAMYFHLPWPIKALIFFINIILIFLYAPADTSEKPVIDQKQKKTLRFWSLVMMVVLYVFSLFQSQTISQLILLATFAECLTITPIAYAITNSKRGDAYDETS